MREVGEKEYENLAATHMYNLAGQGSSFLVVFLENAFEVRKVELAVVVVCARIAAVLRPMDAFDVDREQRVEKQGGLWIGMLRIGSENVIQLSSDDIHSHPLPSRETYRGPVRGVQQVEGHGVAHCNEGAEAQRAKAIVSIPRVNDARLAAVPEGHMLWWGAGRRP